MMLVAAAGGVLTLVVLLDAFETVVLPRRVSRRLRLARLVMQGLWLLWSRPAGRMRNGERRETYLSFYGPLTLMALLGVWAAGLIVGFALLHWGLGANLSASWEHAGFATSLYGSGTTFFTLGLGDVLPQTGIGRVLVVLEAGIGMAFLALVIAYVPVLHSAFSQREVNVSLLDARAGSPPCAVELLRLHAGGNQEAALLDLFREWERWAAELLESHLSYPILAYYRSQHAWESWLAALTVILYVSTLVIVGVDDTPPRAARMAFAAARHTAADQSHVLGTRPKWHGHERLPAADLAQVRARLRGASLRVREEPEADEELAALRCRYEPFITALADELLMPLPRWLPRSDRRDEWQTTLWNLADHDVDPVEWPTAPPA